MDLISIYTNYKELNNEYTNYLTSLVSTELGECENQAIKDALLRYQNKFEVLKMNADIEEITSENENDLKDLRYLLMDALFASHDVLSFYSQKQVERFKMRAVNYVNKVARANIFNESMSGTCRVQH